MNSNRSAPAFPISRRQAGLTLLEVLLSLTIIASATIGLNAVADRFSDDTKNTVTASQVRTFGEAAKAYIKDNYSAVQAIATATTPALIDVPTLIAAGNLTAGFVPTNAYGQSLCALVLEPVANRLQAMVLAEDGTAIDDLSVGNIAAVVGGSGGGVYSSDATVIRGAIGGWSIPASTFDGLTNNVGRKCNGTAGNVRVTAGHPVMALWFENGDTSSAFVARDAVPGRPELNAMNTPLVMNSVQTVGAACTASGAIAQDGAGGILSCQGGAWKAPGDGKCVGTSADLNNLQTDGRCYNGAGLPNSPAGGDWVFVEVYRHINQAAYYTAQRVIGMTGGSVGRVWQRVQQSGTAAGGWGAWMQQADSQVAFSAGGSVTAAGQIQANNLRALSDIVTYGVTYNVSNNWAFQGLDAGWGGNAAPQNATGSAYVNDVLLRSSGKWASTLGINYAARFWYNPGCSFGGPCECPGGTVMLGTYGWWTTYTNAYYLCAPAG